MLLNGDKSICKDTGYEIFHLLFHLFSESDISACSHQVRNAVVTLHVHYLTLHLHNNHFTVPTALLEKDLKRWLQKVEVLDF